jgi:lauroyl/myristoyl acyltransferase
MFVILMQLNLQQRAEGAHGLIYAFILVLLVVLGFPLANEIGRLLARLVTRKLEARESGKSEEA